MLYSPPNTIQFGNREEKLHGQTYTLLFLSFKMSQGLEQNSLASVIYLCALPPHPQI